MAVPHDMVINRQGYVEGTENFIFWDNYAAPSIAGSIRMSN